MISQPYGPPFGHLRPTACGPQSTGRRCPQGIEDARRGGVGVPQWAGSYPDDVLAVWAERIMKWAVEGGIVLVYFNNDMEGSAVLNALKLRELVKGAT